MAEAEPGFSHLDNKGRASMVDVGDKEPSRREAVAQALVHLPDAVVDLAKGDEIFAPKGAVFQTAILAGTQAAKRTSDLIPLCHPLQLEKIRVDIRMAPGGLVVIRSKVGCHGRTGVEMEALTAATVAALTVYDMCKGVSQEVVIREIRLLEKSGGKRNYRARGYDG